VFFVDGYFYMYYPVYCTPLMFLARIDLGLVHSWGGEGDGVDGDSIEIHIILHIMMK